MIALYIIIGIFVLLAVILSLNCSLRLIFDSSAEENINIYAKIGFYKIYIIPEKFKKTKKKKAEKIKKTKNQRQVKLSPEKTDGEIQESEIKENYGLREIFDAAKKILPVIWLKLRKRLKIRIYKIDAVLASDEAHKTALIYGSAIQSAHYFNEILERNFRIYKRPDNIKIVPDFSKINPEFNIDVKFSMRLINLLGLLLSVIFKIKSIKI